LQAVVVAVVLSEVMALVVAEALAVIVVLLLANLPAEERVLKLLYL
jgi:hypothetical protein